VLVAELLDELAQRVPNLPGAACKGRPSTFDVADRHDPKIEAAQAICRTCPALRDCRAWLDGLPRSARPCGVVAARYIAPPRPSAYVPRPRVPSGRELAAVWLRGYLAEHAPVLGSRVIADPQAFGIRYNMLAVGRRDLGGAAGAAARRSGCPPHVGVNVFRN
jgi:hypothetical protein